jgi:hypothetical protein
MKYLDHLFRDAGAVELRHQIKGKKSDRWVTYWFDDLAALQAKARRLTTGNLFTSLHRPAEIPDGALKNEHVTRYTRLLFDLDPVRPAQTSSTAEELVFAQKAADALQKALRAWGWPEPLRAMSGNGRHLQYRCALPNDDATAQILKTIYRGMKVEFSDENVGFDSTVRNAGRICALYGTVKRKGDNTLERPHRQSEVWIPGNWKQVTSKQIESVANFYAKQRKTVEIYRPDFNRKVSGKGDYSTLDIVAWFSAHGLYEHHIEDHKHSVTCPWESEHSESQHNDTLIFESDGTWPGFFCHHGHCAGRTIQDVMQVLGDADAFCGRGFGDGAA